MLCIRDLSMIMHMLRKKSIPKLQDSNHHTPPPPTSPSQTPGQNSDPNTAQTTHGPKPITSPAKALLGTVSRCCILVSMRVQNAPNSSTGGRKHGDDAPIRGEILYPPHNVDDDRDESKGATVSNANERTDHVEQLRNFQGQCCAEEEEADGEKEGGREEEC